MGKRRAELVAHGELPDPDRTGLFTTGFVSITADGPIALFFSGRKHAGGELHLAARGARSRAATAHSHVRRPRSQPAARPRRDRGQLSCARRRHIVDEADNFPAECRHVLEGPRQGVQKDRRACKEQALSDDERLAVHQRDSAPVMAELQRWMHAELDEKTRRANSGLGDAFDYLLKRWTS